MTKISVDSLLDQAKIQAVLNLYATALDRRDWPALDEVFIEDATAHYEGMGVFKGRTAIVELVSQVLNQCGPTQHLLGTYRIDVAGDNATAECYLAATHAGLDQYAGHTLTVWGEYRDKLIRTPEGWRIIHRELASIHNEGDIGLK